MKNKIFTLLFTLVCILGLGVQAQTTFNVPSTDTLNVFINNNPDAENGAVYVLERNSMYKMSGPIDVQWDITIKAADGDGMRPYIVMDVNESGEAVSWIMGGWSFTGSLTLQSVQINNSSIVGNRGAWRHGGFFLASGDIDVTIDDCIFDYFDGVIISAETAGLNSLKVTNSLFRKSGFAGAGTWQGFGFSLKHGSIGSLYIENNTFLEGVGPIFLIEDALVGDVWFNHNTVVNYAQMPFKAEYYTEAVFMNNLFVNTRFAGESFALRVNQDPENLPYGIVNGATYAHDTLQPEGFPVEEERVMVLAYNANYLSDGILDFWENPGDLALDTAQGGQAWATTDFTDGTNGFVNSRVKSMLKDDAAYPYWMWNDSLSVYTDELSFNDYSWDDADLVAFAKKINGDTTAVADVSSGAYTVHPDVDNPGQATMPDQWDLSYTSATLECAANASYPVGDLNWFPTKKAEWENDANRESFDDIVADVKSGSFTFEEFSCSNGIFNSRVGTQSSFKVYPNPTNGIATVSAKLESTGIVRVDVYNALGQKMKTVAHERASSGRYVVTFDANELGTGTYFVNLISDNFTSTQMLVVE